MWKVRREVSWVMDIDKDLKKTIPIPSSSSIWKVPTKLRSVNEDAYTPHAVSIGPFHHGDKKLQPMEDSKWLFLLSLFRRTQKPQVEILEDCRNKILALDEKVRACYAEPIKLDNYDLAKILLYDAGFVLELFFEYFPLHSCGQRNPIPIPSWKWVILKRDLVLLENQIPLFVLDSLFNIIKSHVGDAGLHTLEVLALRFFRPRLNISGETSFNEIGRMKADHLLHLLYNFYLPSELIDSTSNVEQWKFIPSATSLQQAGVVFQKNKTEDLLDIKFEDGTFKIPVLYIEDNTESLFRNLVAFEQCQEHNQGYLTSYFAFMDHLIDTAKDVELLQEMEIIRSDLGRPSDVSTLINNFGKHVVYHGDGFYYAKLCSDVNAYAESRCHPYMAALRRDYFKNPWSITSFVAAFILLVLTLLQTVFAVCSYYQCRY